MANFDPKISITPFFALREIEDEKSRSIFLGKFLKSPPRERELLVAIESAEIIQKIAADKGIPQFAEVLSFCARQVLCKLSSLDSLADWLGKQAGIEVGPAKQIISDLVDQLKSIKLPSKPKEEVVKTVGGSVIPGQQVNPNNIIDLRRQNK